MKTTIPTQIKPGIYIFFLLHFIVLCGFSQKLYWAKAIKGLSGGTAQTHGIAYDRNENVYITGKFTGTVDFDPGPGIFYLTDLGSSAMFISKLDSAGSLVWAIKIGSDSNFVTGNSIAVDDTGNVVVCGTFNMAVDFDPDTGIFLQNTFGLGCPFAIRLTTSGKFEWVVTYIGGTGTGNSICFDDSGNAYVAGNWQITPFFSKINPAGQLIWTSYVGANNGGKAEQIISGKYGYLEAFGNKSDQAGSPGYTFHATINKLNGDVTNVGPATCINSMTYDANGNFYHCGWVGSVSGDICIRKIGNTSSSWYKTMSGPGNEYAYHIEVDNAGNVLVVGSFNEAFDADPSSGIYLLQPISASSIFILKLSPVGDFLWAQVMVGNPSVVVQGIKATQSGNIYITGYFSGNIDFDLSKDTSFLNSSSTSAFIARMGNCNLSIYQQPDSITVSLDDSAQFYITLTGNAANYQWQQNSGSGYSDLIDGINISGSNDDTLIIKHITNAQNSTHYRCIVNDGICTFTSDDAILTVKPTGLDEASTQPRFEIYPNPAFDELNIIINSIVSEQYPQDYSIYDLSGRMLAKGVITESHAAIDISGIARGLYIIEAGNQRQKVLKY